MPPETLASIVEEVCLNAWPALQEVHYDGWILRFAGGATRRTNSVNVIGPGRLTFAEKIAAAERIYAAQGAPAIFRVLSTARDGLDAALAAAGYRAADPTVTLYADLGPAPMTAVNDLVSVSPHPPGAEWLVARNRFQGRSAEDDGKVEKILGALAIPAAFGAARAADGRIVSIAKGAVHRGIVCLNLVATDPAHLRQGHSRACIGAVLRWAQREHGATGACLQVLAANAPAISLYRQLGFTQELYRYHYRVRD